MAQQPYLGETLLSGGNVTTVVRIGDTVRRATGPWSPAIHAFPRLAEQRVPDQIRRDQAWVITHASALDATIK